MRLLAKTILKRVKPVGDCLCWTGHYNPCGLPVLSHRSVRRRIYEAANGPLESRLFVGMTCGTKGCVSLACMVARTKTEARKVARPSATRSVSLAIARRKRSFLSEADVQEIRLSELPGAALGLRYGISKGHANAIRSGRAWVNYSNPFAGLGARA